MACFPSHFPARGGASYGLQLPAQPVSREAVVQIEPRTTVEPNELHMDREPLVPTAGSLQQHSSPRDKDTQSQTTTSGRAVLQKHNPSPFPTPSPSSSHSQQGCTDLHRVPLSLIFPAALPLPTQSLFVELFCLSHHPTVCFSPVSSCRTLGSGCKGQNCLCCSTYESCSKVSVFSKIFLINLPFSLPPGIVSWCCHRGP